MNNTSPQIRVHDAPQGSDEWLDARRGMVTASMIGSLITASAPDATTVDCPACGAAAGDQCTSTARKLPTPIKTPHEPRTAAANLLPPVYRPATNDTAQALTLLLVAERINGWSDPVFVTNDMLRGTLEEPLARDLYATHYRVPVTEVGLIVRSDWGFDIGCSPDGIVGDDGLIEVKSRRSKNHLATILDDRVPAENMAQIQCGLLVTGRAWCDYLSYCGGMPMWPKRVYPDAAWQRAIVEAVHLFEATAADMVATYTQRTAGLPATERSTYDMEIV